MLERLMQLVEAPEPPAPPTPPKDEDETQAKRQKAQQRRQRKKKGRSATSAEQQAAKRARAQAKAAKTREKKRKAAMKAAAAENKKKRQARKAELAKKRKKKTASGTRDKASPAGKSPAEQVPAQLRHCMLALKYKRKKSTTAAWNICRWSLTKHGYMKGPYRINTKLPKATRQTSKGTRRSFQHGMEKGPLNKGIPGTGATKARKFDKMFKEIEKDVIKKGR